MSSIFNNAQEYKPMLNHENEWHLTSCYYGCITDKYYTNGDTLVNNQTHKILDGYHYISRTFLLREDQNQRKVYLTKINPNKIDQYLLYDFSMEIGDSIQIKNPITPFPENGGFYKLDSINSKILQDNNSYRHFYLSPSSTNQTSNYPITWIEGIGSLSMINAAGGNANINGVGKLSCLFKNGNIIYQNLDSISECVSTFSIEKENKSSNEKIYYNRIEKSYVIKTEIPIKKIDVYTVTNKKIKSFYFDSNENLTYFKIERNTNEVLFIQATLTNNKKRYFKIISQI